MSRVLLIQSDSLPARSLALALARYGHRPRWRPTGLSGLKSVIDESPDVVLLDHSVTDVHPLQVLAMMRAVSSVPVIALIATTTHADVAAALERDADAFLARPCHPDELDAKIREVLGQERPPVETLVTVGDMTVDPRSRTVVLCGAPVNLSRLEFDLLVLLARHLDQPISREDVRRALWPGQAWQRGRSLDVLLWTLRRKLGESGTHPRYIITVPRVGIVLRAPSTDAAEGSATPSPT